MMQIFRRKKRNMKFYEIFTINCSIIIYYELVGQQLIIPFDVEHVFLIKYPFLMRENSLTTQ